MLVTGFVLDAIKVKTSPAAGGDTPSDWLDLVKWAGSPDPVPDKFWRTLVADRGTGGNCQPPAYFPLACKWVFQHSDESRLLSTSKILENAKCPSIATEFLRRVQSVVWGRSLALSEGRRGSKQLLSLVPQGAQEGDIICIIYGCSVPVILRKRKKRNAEMPTFTRETTREGKRPLILQDDFEISVLQLSTVQNSDNSTRPSETQKQSLESSSTSLAVPAEQPNSAFSSHSVRKVLGEDSKERKPPSVAVLLDSQNQYSFIGECYVHGMMAGEGFKHQHEHGNSLKAFHLV